MVAKVHQWTKIIIGVASFFSICGNTLRPEGNLGPKMAAAGERGTEGDCQSKNGWTKALHRVLL